MHLLSLADIQKAIGKASESPVSAPKVTIIGASKHQPVERIERLIGSGLADFGENMVQEAQAKWPELRARHPQVRLHLIGPLQTNKAKPALALFDCIHSLDRSKLAQTLAEEMQRSGRRIPCFIQVNTGEEPQKAGVIPAQADAFIAQCRNVYGLEIAGLMCVPPVDQPPAPHFALLRKIVLRNGLSGLSMGMSDDFETAVRMGATHVRIGRALFGERA